MEQIRSFIAIELPDELKLELTRLEARLKSSGQTWVKWVDPYSIHLTLKFLGSIPVDRVGEITKGMEEAARVVPPFRLEVRGLGVFPSLGRAQVAWVGVEGEVDKLGQLQQGIESSLEPLGFTPEARPFTPHLTLARLRNQASSDERRSFGQLVVGTSFEAARAIEVGAVSLMKSWLTREGAIYSRISSVRLNRLLSTPTA